MYMRRVTLSKFKLAGRGKCWQRWLTEELDIAWLTVRVVTVLFERALVQKFQAESTGEVLRMPLTTHSSNTLA